MEEKIKYYYYSITNTLNNKKYCGITKDPTVRWQKHRRELKNNCHHSIKLQNAVNKYGLDNFSFQIVEEKEFDCITEAFLYEEIFIKNNDSYLNGYNMTPGGLGVKSALSFEKTKKSWWQKVDNVYQIDKNTYEIINIFPSLREIERQLKFAHSNIGKVCNRTDVSAYGYY